MTQRLYYDSPKLMKFSSETNLIHKTDRGYEVLLYETAFYPTSGGQPHDRGSLDGIPVMDVWDDKYGNVWHLLESSPKKGEISGQIDWIRRFDHMQQHSGQHILSSVFIQELDAKTIGFQIGSAISTIDIEIPTITPTQIRAVEKASNGLIWENHPVTIHYVTEDDINKIPFRKPPQVQGQIRVIWIPGIDASACGGTHVGSTGEVGIIKIINSERYKGNIRISFLCGNRALSDYQKLHDNVDKICKELSIHKEHLANRVSRMQAEISDYQKALKFAREEIMEYLAVQLWNDSETVNGTKLVFAYLGDRVYDELLIASNKLRTYPDTVILLGISEKDKLRVICSRSHEQVKFDAKKIIKSVLLSLNGKGGGNSEIAFGGAPITDPEIIINAFQDALEYIKTDQAL